MTPRKRRLTVTVDPELVEAGNRAVASGAADSLSAWVSTALAEKARRDQQLAQLRTAIAGYEAEFGEISAEDWDRTFIILTRAVFLGIKYSIEPMRKAGGGSIMLAPGKTYSLNRYVAPGNGVEDLVFAGCNGLTIEGNGATIRIKGDIHRDRESVRVCDREDQGSGLAHWYSRGAKSLRDRRRWRAPARIGDRSPVLCGLAEIVRRGTWDVVSKVEDT